MALADYSMTGFADLDFGEFRAILDAADSPALEEAHAIYEVLTREAIKPAVWLAFGWVESKLGAVGIVAKYGTKNMGNVRTPETPGAGVVIQTERGPFVKYHTWANGALDWAARIKGPKYAGAGLTTVRQVIPKYAPSGDDNSPEHYIAAVLARIALWSAPDAPQPTEGRTMPKIALAAGHRNRDGGNDYEAQTTALLTPAIAAACRARGLDVRVLTPDDGRGMFPGGIWDVARAVVQLAASGWVPDIFLEVHTEGVGNPATRGVFAIYPDWGSDVDADVRDKLGPLVARAVSRATGMPVRGSGVMSEKRTGVGGQGSRLGIFNQTASIRAQTTRLIVEYGAHTNPDERAMHRSGAWIDAAARATAESFADYLGVASPLPSRPPGWLNEGDADVFRWEGEGVIVERRVVYFNPEKRKYFEREWHHERGYTPWKEIA